MSNERSVAVNDFQFLRAGVAGYHFSPPIVLALKLEDTVDKKVTWRVPESGDQRP